jgi:hypothetical protein
MTRLRVLFSRLLAAADGHRVCGALCLFVCAVAIGGCAHDNRDAVAQRLEAARATASTARDAAAAIAWSDAVGDAPDDGDFGNALSRLRIVQAATFGEDIEPIAAARARLLAAAGRQDEADAAWVEAARAKPTAGNLAGLFSTAERKKASARLRALCAIGPIALPAGALGAWLDRCSVAAGLDKQVASSLWLASDRGRLQSGVEATAATPLEVCLERCRPAFFRAVAGCDTGDERCVEIQSHAFDVCEKNCHDDR